MEDLRGFMLDKLRSTLQRRDSWLSEGPRSPNGHGSARGCFGSNHAIRSEPGESPLPLPFPRKQPFRFRPELAFALGRFAPNLVVPRLGTNSQKQSFTRLRCRLRSAQIGRIAKTVRFSKADINIDHTCLPHPRNRCDYRHCLYFKVGDVLNFYQGAGHCPPQLDFARENGGGCLPAIARRN